MRSGSTCPRARSVDIARRHGVRLLLLHGSLVSGRTHQHSDVDLAASFERPDVTFGTVAALAADLQPLLPEHEVDLSVLAGPCGPTTPAMFTSNGPGGRGRPLIPPSSGKKRKIAAMTKLARHKELTGGHHERDS